MIEAIDVKEAEATLREKIKRAYGLDDDQYEIRQKGQVPFRDYPDTALPWGIFLVQKGGYYPKWLGTTFADAHARFDHTEWVEANHRPIYFD